MKMIIFIALSLVLAGCSGKKHATLEDFYNINREAKNSKYHIACYGLKNDPEVEGVYCLEYKGPLSLVSSAFPKENK